MTSNKNTKNVFRIGLRGKILGLSLPVMIVMVIVLITLAYSVSKTNIIRSSQQLLKTSAKDQEHQIESWLSQKLSKVNTIKYDIEQSGALEHDDILQAKLDYYYDYDSSFIGGFRVADINGNIFQASASIDQTTNVTNQLWFKEGLRRVNPNYTGIYYDNDGNKIISACGMLNDMNNVRIISTNLSIDSINIIVNSSVSMNGAESLLVDKTDGKIFVSRENDLISTKITESDNQFYKKIHELISSEEPSVQTIDNNLVICREISGTDWILVSYIDKNIITANIDKLRNLLIIVAVGCLILICAVNFVAVYYSIRPLRILSEKIKAMAEGDFTITVFPRGTDEISEIERSVETFLNCMHEMISEIHSISENIQNQADASSIISSDMQNSSISQAEAMATLNSSVEQISVSITDLAESATNLSGVVFNTTETSVKIKSAIEKLIKRISEEKVILSQNSSSEAQNAVKIFDEIISYIQDVELGFNTMVNEMKIVNTVAMDVSAVAEEQAASTNMISDTSEKMVDEANLLATQSEHVAAGATMLTERSDELTFQMNKFKI